MTTNENTDQQPTDDAVNAENSPAAPEAQERQSEVAERAQTNNREAAKYRRQLREAEAERDAAVALIEPARRELLAAALLKIEHVEGPPESRAILGNLRPEAIDDAGIDVASVFDGMTLNTDKVRAELKRVYDAKPYLFAAPRMIIPNIAKTPDNNKYDNGFTAAFAPRNGL